MIKRLKFGALALSVYSTARDVAEQIDAGMVLSLVAKVLTLEAEHAGPGQGGIKLRKLLGWFATQYPQYADKVALVQGMVGALVPLLNALQVFRAGATISDTNRGA